MPIEIRGAREHNLADVDVTLPDGLTVVTGVSGSGKTSLVFDTLYHEARRRFQSLFSTGHMAERLAPADVRAIYGLLPGIAVGQNLLNRNPNSTLATASGLHPLLRLLFARGGERHCPSCQAPLRIWDHDQVVEWLVARSAATSLDVSVRLMHQVVGSHRTLVRLLGESSGAEDVVLDGRPLHDGSVNPRLPHNLDLVLARGQRDLSPPGARALVDRASALGAYAINVVRSMSDPEHATLSWAPVCTQCGSWLEDVSPTHFHRQCPSCQGKGCVKCHSTGLHPLAASVFWHGMNLVTLLTLSVDAFHELLRGAEWSPWQTRLHSEIERRVEALRSVGLGYVSLNRPSPSLSRGESQRVRLAVALTSQLEDMLHVLDEPTIGQHPADVRRLVHAFRRLRGPVVFVEHDRIAAAQADHAIDLGPGAGHNGGHITFQGSPAELWASETPTGRHFALRAAVSSPERRPEPTDFVTIRGAYLRNLQHIDVPIPLGRLTVVTGVSGSGKSTLVEDVLAATLLRDEPTGCDGIEGPHPKVIVVDQSPIGRNPRSNPATYTKLSDILRNLFAASTPLTASHFSFNRPEGACPVCKGIGAIEVKMRYLPSTWIPCAACAGQRFSDQVLAERIPFGDKEFNIADVLSLSIQDLIPLLPSDERISSKDRRAAGRILTALADVGLGYVTLGQASPTLSGGEAQRVKLARYLGRRSLARQMMVLDEPTTGLHPQDVSGLLVVLDRLVRHGATLVVVEHNTDVMRAADWLVDLGPGCGPEGGRLLFCGPPNQLLSQSTVLADSPTGRALRNELAVAPRSEPLTGRSSGEVIRIQDATAHNLQHVSVEIPKGKLTVVTGVSGSGKSSLVGDVLESEARRRYVESLSMYERQGSRPGPEAEVKEVTGLGVSVMIGAGRGRRYDRRATVGSQTEILHHLASLLAAIGHRACLACGADMLRGQAHWLCPDCGATDSIARPRHFSPATYAAACKTCQGTGFTTEPNPAKLIIHPERSLCGGAMYSPGFFPQGYLCKPFNGGYDMVQALARAYDFHPSETPWDAMSNEARQAFLYGTEEQLEVVYRSRKGRVQVRKQRFPGFYRWIGDWDSHGTYTDRHVCSDCQGGRLRPEYAAVTLAGHNLQAMGEMPLGQLEAALAGLVVSREHLAYDSLVTVQRRLLFLRQVGLAYLHLYRDASTLSAGEAQRIKLAKLLGSDLTSLTVLLDEPTRGLHPIEVGALTQVLHALRDEGNTVVVVEHDLDVIRSADRILEMGPGAGRQGGHVVAQGTVAEVAETQTATGRWLSGRRARLPETALRGASGWLTIEGAVANNLHGEEVRIPLGVMVGICGVSGSGKSSLIVDTLGRALAPKRHTTSVAYEEIEPGKHRAIHGAPERTIIVDQTKAGISSPVQFLRLAKSLVRLYAESEQAQALGLDAEILASRCASCRGTGHIAIDMEFLPQVRIPCETCRGTGCAPEAWQVAVDGIALAQAYALTIDELYARFGHVPRLARPLEAARKVGLGYLALRQPGYALSGGEAQRLKIARELLLRTRSETLFILDEPSVGQHLEDVSRLIGVLRGLVHEDHTVLVVEHHTHMLAACDWLIELGPGAGPEGGHVIATGPPAVMARRDTPTAPFLRKVLERHG